MSSRPLLLQGSILFRMGSGGQYQRFRISRATVWEENSRTLNQRRLMQGVWSLCFPDVWVAHVFLFILACFLPAIFVLGKSWCLVCLAAWEFHAGMGGWGWWLGCVRKQRQARDSRKQRWCRIGSRWTAGPCPNIPQMSKGAVMVMGMCRQYRVDNDWSKAVLLGIILMMFSVVVGSQHFYNSLHAFRIFP